jgi:hypothetical protein
MLQGIADYDALTAAKRMRLYALLSTIAAAISALASALAAYFAYLSVRHYRPPHHHVRVADSVLWNLLGQ